MAKRGRRSASGLTALVGGGLALLAVALFVSVDIRSDGDPPRISAIAALPPRVPLPPPPVYLGRYTFTAEEQVRITSAIDRLLQHPSDFCVDLARSAWHRWQDDRISDGRSTRLCPTDRFGYMGRGIEETYLCERAFESEVELIATLAHEERHHLHPDDRHLRARDWDAMCLLGGD